MGNSRSKDRRTRAPFDCNHRYLIRAPGTSARPQIFAYFNPSFGSHMRENGKQADPKGELAPPNTPVNAPDSGPMLRRTSKIPAEKRPPGKVNPRRTKVIQHLDAAHFSGWSSSATRVTGLTSSLSRPPRYAVHTVRKPGSDSQQSHSPAVPGTHKKQ